jgi:hypothetical protein
VGGFDVTLRAYHGSNGGIDTICGKSVVMKSIVGGMYLSIVVDY